MMNTKTTEILRQTGTTFIALTDNGGVRFGLVGSMNITTTNATKIAQAKELAAASLDDDSFDDAVFQLSRK